MNVLSLFNGISIGRLALNNNNIPVDRYYSSEIKDIALTVADANFPQDSPYKLGDIKEIDGKSLPKIDLLIGGSNCQDFSIANRVRNGLQGTKSSLFYEYVRLLDETSPTYFFLENVQMKQEDADIISGLLGVEPIKINSKLYSPQLRNRWYWTNIPVSLTPPSNPPKLQDILTDGYTDREKARALLVSDSRPLTTPIKMVHRYFNTGFTTLVFKSRQHYLDCKEHFEANGFKGNSAVGISRLIEDNNIDVSVYDGVRYLNQRELEACQTVPEGYTEVLTRNQAADVLGDGWTTSVITDIFKGLA